MSLADELLADLDDIGEAVEDGDQQVGGCGRTSSLNLYIVLIGVCVRYATRQRLPQ